MYKPQMIENEKNLYCQMKHELPVQMVILDSKLTQNQKLLCQECINNFESSYNKTIGFKKVVQKIEENIQQQLYIKNLIITNIKQVESFQIQINNLKSIVLQQLDQLISNTDDWIQSLKQTESQYSEYSFFKELDIIINQQNNKDDLIKCQNQIKILNQSWITKVNSKLEQFKSFQEYQQLKEKMNQLIKQINNQVQINYYLLMIQMNKKKFVMKLYLIQLERLWFQLVKTKLQFGISIMERLKKFKCFQNIKKLLIVQYIVKLKIILFLDHKMDQLYYGNSWIIINGKVLNQKMSIRKVSIVQSQHKMKINQFQVVKIPQLIYGEQILLIINQHFSILYKNILIKSSHQVQMNQKDYQLHVDQTNQQQFGKKMQTIDGIYLNLLNNPKLDIESPVKFIQEDKFIWVSYSANSLCVFEQKDGQFQEIVEKKVQFSNFIQKCLNLPFFPIIYIKDKNLICLRHMKNIVLLKEQNDGQLSIVQELDCQDWSIHGTVTKNGQYIIFWGGKKKKYEIFEIQYK